MLPDAFERSPLTRPRALLRRAARLLPGLLSSAVSLSACRAREAPESVDQLAHWYWVNYDDLTDDEVLDGVQNLDDQVTAHSDRMPIKGKVDDLTADDILHIPLPPGTDPTLAQGMVVVTYMPCTLEQVEQIFIGDDFGAMFPDVYVSYRRDYKNSFDDYTSRKSSVLEWTTTYQADIVGDIYTAEVQGEARWVPEMARDEGPRGPALLSRTVLLEPAVFESPTTKKSLTQDYQIDLYYEHTPGQVVHMFADWRQMNAGSFSMDDDVLVNISLSNFVDWDSRMSEYCGKVGP